MAEGVRRAAWKAVAICAGLAVAAALAEVFGKGAGAFFEALYEGAAGSPGRVIAALAKAPPLILAGLAVAIPLRAGLFNIGGEGQMYAGAVGGVAAAVGFSFLPGPVLVPLALLFGITAGAAYGGAAGTLKARFGVHEVISTIMLNFIAWHATAYLVNNGPLSGGVSMGRTAPIPEAARLPVVASSGAYELSASIAVALVAAAAAWWFVAKSVTGFRMRAAGGNALAAERRGIDVKGLSIGAMAIGGAFAGLAGIAEVAGVHYSLSAGFSPGYGFDGIAVALLAGESIMGIVPAAVLFGALRAAGPQMHLTAGLSPEMIYVIEAVVIVAAAAPRVPRWFGEPGRGAQ